MDLSGEFSNSVFEVLDDWEAQLKPIEHELPGMEPCPISSIKSLTKAQPAFASVVGKPSRRRKAKTPLPFSLRLSTEERERLEHAAGDYFRQLGQVYLHPAQMQSRAHLYLCYGLSQHRVRQVRCRLKQVLPGRGRLAS